MGQFGSVGSGGGAGDEIGQLDYVFVGFDVDFSGFQIWFVEDGSFYFGGDDGIIDVFVGVFFVWVGGVVYQGNYEQGQEEIEEMFGQGYFGQ